MYDNTRSTVREVHSRSFPVLIADVPTVRGLVATCGLLGAWALTAAELLPRVGDVLLLPAALLVSGTVVALVAGGAQ